MDVARAHPHHPNLRLGKASAQPVACLQLIRVDYVHPAVDVDGGKFALVVNREVGTDFVLINGVAAPGKLFLAVTALGRGHVPSPILPDAGEGGWLSIVPTLTLGGPSLRRNGGPRTPLSRSRARGGV